MCKSADMQAFYRSESERLKIKAFCVQLSLSKLRKSLPESLTLLFLPRINGSPLEIEESKIRSDSPAFVTLYRAVAAADDRRIGEVLFVSREGIKASEGVRFEVFVMDEKLLKGVFRKDEDEEWYMECKCALESEIAGVAAAEVVVAVEGQAAMAERVEMVVRRRKRRCFVGLEEIPEQKEVERELDGCCCLCGKMECGSDGEAEAEAAEEDENEKMDMVGVGWAVDVGIWVMCLGVGILVSNASAKRLRRRRRLF